jgi:CRP-like cAMP-binding protein
VSTNFIDATDRSLLPRPRAMDSVIGQWQAMDIARNGSANHLLAALPDRELRRWLPLLEAVDLATGQILHEAHGDLKHLYFPSSAIVALSCVMEDGASSECMVIGREGVIGFSHLATPLFNSSRAVVQSGGSGFRMEAKSVLDEFTSPRPDSGGFFNYYHALMKKLLNSVSLNQRLSVEQQFCNWLLRSLEHVNGCDLLISPELIQMILGVRPDAATAVALKLQDAGLIRYTKCRITVIDRDGLQLRSENFCAAS